MGSQTHQLLRYTRVQARKEHGTRFFANFLKVPIIMSRPEEDAAAEMAKTDDAPDSSEKNTGSESNDREYEYEYEYERSGSYGGRGGTQGGQGGRGGKANGRGETRGRRYQK